VLSVLNSALEQEDEDIMTLAVEGLSKLYLLKYLNEPEVNYFLMTF
jgi:hypothetical protein